MPPVCRHADLKEIDRRGLKFGGGSIPKRAQHTARTLT